MNWQNQHENGENRGSWCRAGGAAGWERTEVIAPSHPGFGNSSRPDDFDTIYDLVHCYQDLIDALPFDKLALIGCSFGGWIAAELAINYGHRIERLVLVDPLGIKVGGREERASLYSLPTPTRKPTQLDVNASPRTAKSCGRG